MKNIYIIVENINISVKTQVIKSNMVTSISGQLSIGRKLREKGQYKEALNLVLDIEKSKGLTLEDRIECMIFRGNLYNTVGKLNDALEIAEKAYQESLKHELKLQALDALYIIGTSCFYLGKRDKFQENFKIVEKLHKSLPELSPTERTKREAMLMGSKGALHALNAKFDLSVDSFHKALQLWEKIGHKRGIIQNLDNISRCYIYLGKLDQALEYAVKHLDLQKEVNNRVGIVYGLSTIIGVLMGKGELDQALNYGEQVLAFKEILTHATVRTLYFMSEIYRIKGELDLALVYCEKALESSEKIDWERRKIEILIGLGKIHHMKGNFELSLEFLNRGVELSKGHNALDFLGTALFQLIITCIDNKSMIQAVSYLQHFQQLREEVNTSNLFNRLYQVANAYILKASNQINKIDQAELILRQVTEEKIFWHSLTTEALVSLCQLLLNKLKRTNNSEILNEIKSIITRLLRIAEEQRSYNLLAKTHVFKAQIAVIEANYDEASRLFAQAQRIADWHGLNRLARWISKEHDTLLEELDKWKERKKKEAIVSESIDLTSLEATIDIILERRGVKPPELTHEEPVLLLIIAEGGIPAFSISFAEEWSFEDGFISNFLTAFNTFSEEVFSKGLDRAKLGEYMLVMDSIGSFSVCYLFKGQSYLAKQKLIQFAHRVQNTASIWHVFKSFKKGHQAIVLDENPTLESLITEIFIKKSPEISDL